jgi:hypothetical protein|tara:strand:+ start:754 stop:1839 length:1086 start_codon:yes stop_codon:yes gene_type:complete
MGSVNTQATRSTLTSVDTTLSANINATQDFIPVASTTNFSTSVVAEIESTNEVVSFASITTNLFTYSEDFTQSFWSVAGSVTVTGDADTAPDGTTTADKVTPPSATNASMLGPFASINPSIDDTFSVFCKADGFNFVNLVLQVGASNSSGGQFNLSTGTVVTTQNATASISDEGNGWFRCSITMTTGNTAGIQLIQANSGGTPDTSNHFRSTVTGDNSKSILVWGAQLEDATSLSGYLPTVGASRSGLTTVTRGVNGTTAASASSGDSIQQLPYALSSVDMPVRLRAISVSPDGTGAARLTLCDNNGDTLCDVDIPDGKSYTLNLPEDGIIFPNGVFVSNTVKITAYTVYTEKYSGPYLTS